MNHKRKRHAPPARQASELHREFLDAIRAGRLTRHQFDAWHSLRRPPAGRLVITLREVKPNPVHARKPAR